MSILVEPYCQGCWGIIILDLFILEVYYILFDQNHIQPALGLSLSVCGTIMVAPQKIPPP